MQKNVLEYLENTAIKFPERPAFIDSDRSITFSNLESEARILGSFIAKKTGAFNMPIGVITDRSCFPVIGFMGTLYSGNYYVPIDCKMPKARMDMLIEKLNPAALIYSSNYEGMISGYRDGFCCIEIESALKGNADERLLGEIRTMVLDINPAYIIFTSGSTGTPKGIVISHRSVIDFTDWYVNTMGIVSDDVLGNQAPFYFDLSVKDTYSALASGACVHILPQKFFMFPALLMQYANEHGITTFSWATSAFHLIANSGVLKKHKPDALKRVIVGGEALLAKQLNIWRAALPNIKYINLYGPTEVTVDCTYYFIEGQFADTDAIPIGKACENKQILLLDENRMPVKQGEPGEICVRGSGIACGYYGERDRTDSVFIQNPQNPYYNDIIYCTGDIAVMGEDGNLRFLARKDNQIKHGGYRIELGEIETALSSIEKVKAAICIFDRERDKIVCIFEGDTDSNAVAKGVRELLPKYMTPNIYIKKDNMLYNANGKIDRVRLKDEYYAQN